MRKILWIVLAVVILVAAFLAWKFFGPVTKSPEGKFLYIRTGSVYADVKKQLLQNKILRTTNWFDLVAQRMGYKIIKPGKYSVPNGMSVTNLVRMLKNGSQTPVNLTIIKFRTKEEFARKIGKEFETDSLQMIKFLSNKDSLSHYQLDSNTWACAIIPDTYTFFWNSTPTRIFSKLHEASQKFWTDEKKQAAAEHGLSPCESYTLASIIEEETNLKEDKGKIASVYLNRIKKNMPLQADPTLKFAMKSFALKRIYEKDFRYHSPFNTYLNTGLPPGPICTPSIETIEEVLNSPETQYIYFVANSDFSGSHIFSTNYEDHRKLAATYHEALDKQDSIRKASQKSQ
jgi:peptidoglycan lytic transglycosylase G